jgi:hypothetical protein
LPTSNRKPVSKLCRRRKKVSDLLGIPLPPIDSDSMS